MISLRPRYRSNSPTVREGATCLFQRAHLRSLSAALSFLRNLSNLRIVMLHLRASMHYLGTTQNAIGRLKPVNQTIPDYGRRGMAVAIVSPGRGD